MEPEQSSVEFDNMDDGIVTDPSSINVTLSPEKHQFLSVHVPEDIHRSSFDQLPRQQHKPSIKRRCSWPPSTTIVSGVISTEPISSKDIPDLPLTPKRPSWNRSTSQPIIGGSILKEPRSPRSHNPKTVNFDDGKIERRELKVWYHIDSPRRSSYPRIPSNSSHTMPGSQFSTNLDDPKDFGPYHNPEPSLLGDYDYQYNDEPSETVCQYCSIL